MKHCVITDTAVFAIVENEGRRSIRPIKSIETPVRHMGDIYDLIEPFKLFSVWLMPGSCASLSCLDFCKKTPTDKYDFWFQEAQVEEGRPGCPYAKIRKQSTSFVPFVQINCIESAVWCEDVEGYMWKVSSPGTLLASVFYLEKALEEDVFCSPGHIGKRMMSKLSRNRLAERLDTEELPYREMTMDLFWHRRPELNESRMKYLHMIDKNFQYIGAASSVKLGVGQYVETNEYQPKKPGIWRVKWDAGSSPFNGRIMPAPFSSREWASTDLVEAARHTGCIVQVLEGFYWPESATILDKWSKKIWEARCSLAAPSPDFADDTARRNAYRTVKLIGVATLGRLNKEYSGELYRPDINRMIINRARSNALYSLKKWYEQGHWPALVYRDAYYWFGDEEDINQKIPGVLDHSQELRGYKLEHRFLVSPPVLAAFDEEKTAKTNRLLKAIRERSGA